jgi:hypothetical protein
MLKAAFSWLQGIYSLEALLNSTFKGLFKDILIIPSECLGLIVSPDSRL